MRPRLRSVVLAVAGFCLVSVVTACSTGRNRVRLPDGGYELKCEGSLAGCLMQMEEVCSDNGYDVIRATEKRERHGPLELQTEVVRSQGIVRCRRANALFSPNPPPPDPAPVPTEVPPPLPAHAPLPPIDAPPSAAAPGAPAAPAAPPAPPAPSTPPPPSAAPSGAPPPAPLP